MKPCGQNVFIFLLICFCLTNQILAAPFILDKNGCYEVMTSEWQMISCLNGKTAWRLNSNFDFGGFFDGFGDDFYTTPTTTSTTTTTTTVLPFCSEDVVEEVFSSSDDCIPMPNCPKEGDNPIDLRSDSIQPGVNCKPAVTTTLTTTSTTTTTTMIEVLPYCTEDDFEIDLRSSSQDCIPMPVCPEEGEDPIDLRSDSIQPGVNCKPVVTTTLTTTSTTATTTMTEVLPYCTEDDFEIDLRSSSQDCIPMPVCPEEGEDPIDLRSDSVQPGVNCKPAAKPTTMTADLPFCTEDDDTSGDFDIRSDMKNCIPMPVCPEEGEDPIDLRSDSVQPGVNCKPAEKTTTITPVLPFCTEDDEPSDGFEFDLRSSSQDCIPMPVCPEEDEDPIDLRSDSVQPGVNCKPAAKTTSMTEAPPLSNEDDEPTDSIEFDLRQS